MGEGTTWEVTGDEEKVTGDEWRVLSSSPKMGMGEEEEEEKEEEEEEEQMLLRSTPPSPATRHLSLSRRLRLGRIRLF